MLEQENSLSLAIYVLGVVGVVSVMLLGAFLGERHFDKAKALPYESGIISMQNAPMRFPAHYYLLAMFFVVFDLETIFLLAWSTAVRSLGLFGFVQILIFVIFLLVALLYLWRTGGLDLAYSFNKKKDDIL